MPDTTSPLQTPAVPEKKHPYATLGGLVLAAMALIIALAYLGVSGPAFFSFSLPATLWALWSAVFVLTGASMYLYFTLRAASRLLAQHELRLQAVFEKSQNLRLQSLEDSRVGSDAGSLARDGRLDSLEQTRETANGADAGDARPAEPARLLREIARLEARIATLEERPAAAPGAP